MIARNGTSGSKFCDVVVSISLIRNAHQVDPKDQCVGFEIGYLTEGLRDSDPSMKIAVGIITYNNGSNQIAKLGGSLDNAIRHSERAPDAFVLISIANGAMDAWPQLQVQHLPLPTEGNIGFARAANKLFEKAKLVGCDVLILANPDGAFHHRCLKYLLDAHDSKPDDILEARQFPEEHPKYYEPDSGLTNWSSGACLLVPMSCYERVGGMDERFFLYMEDVDFSWRARSAGFSVRVVPKALFSHDVIGREENQTVQQHSLESQLRFYRKWRGPRRRIRRIKSELIRLGFACPDCESSYEVDAIDANIRDFTQPYFGKGRW